MKSRFLKGQSGKTQSGETQSGESEENICKDKGDCTELKKASQNLR